MEPPAGIEPAYPDYKSGASPSEMQDLNLRPVANQMRYQTALISGRFLRLGKIEHGKMLESFLLLDLVGARIELFDQNHTLDGYAMLTLADRTTDLTSLTKSQESRIFETSGHEGRDVFTSVGAIGNRVDHIHLSVDHL